VITDDYQSVSEFDTEKIVSMDSATFGLPRENEHVVKIDATHSNMCWFDGQGQRDKDNYEKVWNNLEEPCEDSLVRSESNNIAAPCAASLGEQLAALHSSSG
jgi:hypothetical protein